MNKKFEFIPGEKAAARPLTAAELAELDELRRTWDSGPELQQKYDHNFYAFLFDYLRGKGGCHD